MGKITVYIEALKLKRIDDYCREHNISRSTVLTRGAMSIVNSQPIQKCDYCMKPSVGKYSILTQDWNMGEIKLEKYLCSFHLTKAKSESEVKML